MRSSWTRQTSKKFQQRKGPVQAADDEEGDDDEECNVGTSSAKKKKSRSAQELIIESANEKLDMLEDAWSWEGHWSAKKRKRDFDTFVSGCHSLARKLGGYLPDTTCIDLSAKLFSVTASLEAREQFFERLRTQLVEVVTCDASDGETQLMVDALQPL